MARIFDAVSGKICRKDVWKKIRNRLIEQYCGKPLLQCCFCWNRGKNMTVFKSIWRWIRREAVLSAAILLAAVSAFLVPPDSAYLGYVDYRTLAILFCLMAVMAGLQRLGIFDRLAQELLSRVKRRSSMVLILWGLCFFFSMLITNDVSLITFVPFTMVVLRRIGGETERKLLVPVVVMQTVAANLGSMLTPIGNPQNLYLYGSSGMSAVSFLRLMLPYTLLSLGMLAVWNVLLCRKHRGNAVIDLPEKKPLDSRKKLIAYLVLFVFFPVIVHHRSGAVCAVSADCGASSAVFGDACGGAGVFAAVRPERVSQRGLLAAADLCGLLCVHRKHGAHTGVLRFFGGYHRWQGTADRRALQPDHQQCSGGAAALRIYGEYTGADRGDESRRTGDTDRIYGEPDLL